MNTKELAAKLDDLVRPIAGLAAEHAARVQRLAELEWQQRQLLPQGDIETGRHMDPSREACTAWAEHALAGGYQGPKWQQDARERCYDAVRDWVQSAGLWPSRGRP